MWRHPLNRAEIARPKGQSTLSVRGRDAGKLPPTRSGFRIGRHRAARGLVGFGARTKATSAGRQPFRRQRAVAGAVNTSTVAKAREPPDAKWQSSSVFLTNDC
jgi:hypothetical protein